MTPDTKIKSWSFSSLLSYEECPFRFYLKATGAERPEREPVRGELVHTMAEQYVRGELDKLPKELRRFAKEFEEERELYQQGKLIVEDPWAFDRDLRPCAWGAPEAWLRMKLDQLVLLDDKALRVVDLKTGKRYGNELKHVQQGQLYMIGAFLKYPDAALAEVVFRYLDEGKSSKRVYTRRDMEKFLPKWLARAKAMTDDTIFKAKPNRITCRFCDYGLNVGSGACPYAVPWDVL